MTKYAIIGDIHGHLKPLIKLLAEVEKKGYTPVFTGDLVDRGPYSKEVVELIKEKNYLMVLGNHDAMMIDMYQKLIDFNNDKNDFYIKQRIQQWCAPNNGFGETLASYQLGGNVNVGYGYDLIIDLEDSYIQLFKEHIDWLQTKPYFLKLNDISIDNRDVYISHSSISHVFSDLDKINENNNIVESILWGRKEPIDIKSIYNVFGHTPVLFHPLITDYYSNIDTGCGKNGVLTALLLPELDYISEKEFS